MANGILDSLKDVGYEELDDIALQKCIADGAKSIPFTKLVEWVTKELQFLYSLDEHVNSITTSEDSSSFLMELNSFLKEIGCQYTSLMEGGRINERLQKQENRVLLLEYLLTELKSARMLHLIKPDETMQVTLNESSTATDLKNMLLVMKFPKPPNNIPPGVLFGKVQAKLKEILSKAPPSLAGEPLFNAKLSDKDWHTLGEFYKELYVEYKMRKEMLLKRLDVTIQSFEWSDRLKNKSNEINESFKTKRNTLSTEPNVRLSDILAARKDLAILEKTSSASVRRKTQSDVNKVIIGSVPDRGGRPYEQEPPPPEMPSWQQRSGGPPGGGRGGQGVRGGGNFNAGGGRGGGNFNAGRGGGNFSGPGRGETSRVQAGWNAPAQNTSGQYQNNHQSGGFDRQSGGYDRQSSGGNFSKSGSSGGYQNQGGYDRGGQQYQYQDSTNYDRPGGRGGSRGGGGYGYDRQQGGGQYSAGYNQSNQDRDGGSGYYQDKERRYQGGNQNRGGGSRNYYDRR